MADEQLAVTGPQPEGQVATEPTGALDDTAQATPVEPEDTYDYKKGYKELQPEFTRKSQRLKEVEMENEAMKTELARLAHGQPQQESADPITQNLAELNAQLTEEEIPEYLKRAILSQQKEIFETRQQLSSIAGITVRQTAAAYAQEMETELKSQGVDPNTELGREAIGVLKSRWGLDTADISTFEKGARTLTPVQARKEIQDVALMVRLLATSLLEQRAPKKQPGPPLESPGGGAPEEPAGQQEQFGSFRELANARRKELSG